MNAQRPVPMRIVLSDVRTRSFLLYTTDLPPLRKCGIHHLQPDDFWPLLLALTRILVSRINNIPFVPDEYNKAVDAVYFNATSKTGAVMLCGVARRPKGVCNAFFYLKVEEGELLLAPSLPDTNLQQRVQDEGTYRVQGIERQETSGGARRRRRRRPPTASRLKGPRKQKSLLLKRGLAKSFAYKLLKRGLANLMSPTSTSGVAPPLQETLKSDPAKTVQVEVSLTWSTKWLPFNYDTQMSQVSMASDIAREPWSADYFKLLKRLHQTHYEQMGTIEGTATIDGVEHKLSMPCVRDHTIEATLTEAETKGQNLAFAEEDVNGDEDV
ncbi:hypothetical protein EVAR_32109_1 [Eumeta japonica]|uniref:Uncharacterized protein n=1 Tax=Eumeta variegata TaxID=151549 RepID=A0A4C1V4A9_EUMVA|nr:hypothetical protein EVAR_32109_1 [Eumeta japonica]